jgi:hypothetical protein
MWWVGAAAAWLVGAWTVALVIGAVLRRSHGPAPVGSGPAPEPVALTAAVPAQRAAPPPTPPHGLRSQGYLTCVAPVRPRP